MCIKITQHYCVVFGLFSREVCAEVVKLSCTTIVSRDVYIYDLCCFPLCFKLTGRNVIRDFQDFK